jgi:hypothetical protein
MSQNESAMSDVLARMAQRAAQHEKHPNPTDNFYALVIQRFQQLQDDLETLRRRVDSLERRAWKSGE